MSERPLIVINVFYGGKIGRGSREGMTYTIDDPTFTFFGNERTTLQYVRNQIMANFEITEVAHTLGLKARWNVGTTEPYFEPIVVGSEDIWQNVLQTTIASRLHLIHLYVTIKPIRAHQTPMPGFFQNYQYEMEERNDDDAEYEEVGEEDDDYDFDADGSNDGDAPEPFDGRHLCEREGINTGESNYEKDIRSDCSEDDKIEHLCAELGDITGMAWTQDDYFGGLTGVKSGIDPGALYKSKADLKTAIREYHVDKMAEVYVVNSNQTFVQWKCKHNSCKWALYATNQGGQWMVKTQTGTHVCTVANPRENHKQLTSTLVAEDATKGAKRRKHVRLGMDMDHMENIEGPCSATGSRGRRRTRGRGSRQPNRAPSQAAIRRATGRPSPQQHQAWMSTSASNEDGDDDDETPLAERLRRTAERRSNPRYSINVYKKNF